MSVRWIVVFVLLLAGVAIAAIAWTSDCGGGAPLDLETLASLDPLDPQRYEASIKAIDREIFTSGTLDEARKSALSGSLRTLADDVSAPENNALALHFAEELRTLAHMSERHRATPIESGPLQDQWMRIRSSLFDDAWWFARSEADLHRPEPGPNPMLVAPGDVALLRTLLDQLADMARELPEELGRLSVAEAPSWQALWRSRLSAIEARMLEEPPFPANIFFVHAIRGGREGVRILGRLPDSHREWTGRERAAWTELYDQAARTIEKARKDLSEVQVREGGDLARN